MIYTEATMMLWPRLLHAARAIDPAVADALQGYMLAGGQFTPQGKTLFPSGTMTPAEAERFKAEKFEPNRKVIVQAVNAAKTADHPWVPAVRAKWEALDKKAADLFEELRATYDPQATDRTAHIGGQLRLLTIMSEAITVGEALNYAGFEGYADRLVALGQAHADLLARVVSAGIPYDPLGKSVAIDTPDGRLWLVDWYPLKPEGWHDGEMRILESDLGVALQKFDGVERWWLAEPPETRPKEKQQTA